METDFNNKYGYCEIPKGLLLYRGHNLNEIIDAVFFTTKSFSASVWGNGIQAWKTKKKIKVLFLVRYIDNFAKAQSSLPDIYYDVFPNEPNKDLDDLDVKQDVRRREPFTKKLYSEFNVCGWLSSIENRDHLEVCIFNKEFIKDNLELINIIKNSDGYKKDSLRKIKIFPTASFFEKSRIVILRHYTTHYNDDRPPYKLQLSRIRSYIKHDVENGGTESDAKEYYYDLRTKLKI